MGQAIALIKMEIARLHYISQAAADGSHLELIARVLQQGIKWVQLRVKDQSETQIFPMAMQAKDLCDRVGARLIINDFPGLALACGAYGVHLGLQDMPVAEARAILGPHTCIGGTANTYADVCKRADEGVDYIGLGPYRFTATKKNLSPVIGPEGYHRIIDQMRRDSINIPVVAIGGIVQDDIPDLITAGVHGIAASGLLIRKHTLNEDFYVQYSR